jgi:hypothetical protein
MISGTCSQPASIVAQKQAKPSEKTRFHVDPLTGPDLDGLACKPTQTIHLEAKWPAFIVQLEHRDKWNLILRSEASLASSEHSAE